MELNHDEIRDWTTMDLTDSHRLVSAISGARTGARREVWIAYITRLKNLEELALAFDAVNKMLRDVQSRARNLELLVDADNARMLQLVSFPFDISQKIGKAMQYQTRFK